MNIQGKYVAKDDMIHPYKLQKGDMENDKGIYRLLTSLILRQIMFLKET